MTSRSFSTPLLALFCAWLSPWSLLATPAGGPGKRVSHVRLTDAKARKEFYESAGKTYANKRVHIHVKAARIHEKPVDRFQSRSGVPYLVFENGTVPIVARKNDVYLKKARQRTARTDELCIKARVVVDPRPGKAGYVLLVHSVKKAP